MRFRGDQPATLTVEAVIDDGLHFQYPLEEERPIGALFDQYAGPGETVRCTELFHLTAPADNQVGWWVEFSLRSRRPVVRWEYLTWNETAFVPITVYYELNNGTQTTTKRTSQTKEQVVARTRQSSAKAALAAKAAIKGRIVVRAPRGVGSKSLSALRESAVL